MTQRIITASALIAVVVLFFFLGPVAASLLVLGCTLLALVEELRVLRGAGHRVPRWPSWVALLAGAPALAFFSTRAVMPLLVLMLLVNAVRVIFGPEPKLDAMLLSEVPILSIVAPGLALLGLVFHDPAGSHMFYLALAIGIAEGGDTLALFGGVRFGRNKLCEAVSPKKTIEGSMFGLLGSVLAGYLMWGLFSLIGAAVCSGWVILPLALLGGAAGQLGDLFASMVKRFCGVKDFSNIFPGHGGMMDRMDSVLFTGLVIYSFLLLV